MKIKKHQKVYWACYGVSNEISQRMFVFAKLSWSMGYIHNDNQNMFIM